MIAPAELIRALREVIDSKTSVKIVGAVFVITLAALFFPGRWTDYVNITPWVNWLWPWLIVTCAFCGLFLLFTAIDVLGSPIFQRRRVHKRIESYLENMSADESQILGQYTGGHKTEYFHLSDGVVQNLVKQGILYQSGYHPDGSFRYAFTVTVEAEPHFRGDAFQKLVDRFSKRKH
jgi:hypothetical protein